MMELDELNLIWWTCQHKRTGNCVEAARLLVDVTIAPSMTSMGTAMEAHRHEWLIRQPGGKIDVVVTFEKLLKHYALIEEKKEKP